MRQICFRFTNWCNIKLPAYFVIITQCLNLPHNTRGKILEVVVENPMIIIIHFPLFYFNPANLFYVRHFPMYPSRFSINMQHDFPPISSFFLIICEIRLDYKPRRCASGSLGAILPAFAQKVNHAGKEILLYFFRENGYNER